MFEINKVTSRSCSMLGQRGSVFGVGAIEAAKADDRFILLTADLATLSGMDRYQKLYPNQFVNVGIAEQNMIGIAAGLAAEGFHPAATTYATFLTMRSCEQIRHFLGYMATKVVVVGSGAGLSQGYAGNTHYTIEDISMMRVIPNLQVLSPSDAGSAVKLFFSALKSDKPTYIRLTGNLNCPIVYKENVEFEIGGSHLVNAGTDVTIFACGTMVSESIKASKILKDSGISAGVVDVYSIKPINKDAIISAKNSRLLVSVEEHSRLGGLGAAIAEIITETDGYPQLLRLGIKDEFDLAGDYEGLLRSNRLTADLIAEDIQRTL